MLLLNRTAIRITLIIGFVIMGYAVYRVLAAETLEGVGVELVNAVHRSDARFLVSHALPSEVEHYRLTESSTQLLLETKILPFYRRYSQTSEPKISIRAESASGSVIQTLWNDGGGQASISFVVELTEDGVRSPVVQNLLCGYLIAKYRDAPYNATSNFDALAMGITAEKQSLEDLGFDGILRNSSTAEFVGWDVYLTHLRQRLQGLPTTLPGIE